MTIATLLLLPVILLHLQRQGMPRLRWLIFPMLGGIFTGLDHGTWSSAVLSTRIANAMLLNNIAPLWVALFAAIAWRERLSRRFWLALMITLGGMALVVGSDLLFEPSMNQGNLLAVLSSLFYGAYFLVTQRGRTRLDPLIYVWFVDLFAAFSLLGINLSLGLPLSGFDTTTWLIFLVAALIAQVGGYFAIAYALGHLPASVVSPSMIGQPVLSALLAIPFTGENLAPVQWLGGLAVVLGIYLVNISRSKTV